MQGLNVPQAFTSASYQETINELVQRMALAEPHVQTVKTISWLFNVPEGDVKKHVRLLWTHSRKMENAEKRHY